MSGVLRRNTAIAENLYGCAEAILSAQLEECVRQLAKEGRALTAAESAAVFMLDFGKNKISPLFLKFCTCLDLAGLIGQPELRQVTNVSSVAYVQTANCASALKMLFGKTEYTSLFRHDLRSCCEDVSLGRAHYCVLPAASTDDGSFPSFRKLINAYDLKICGMCNVACADREAEMRFALLSRVIEVKESSRFIVFSFLPDADELSPVVQTLGGAGCSVTEINTHPAEFSIDKSECVISVRCDETSPAAVLHFLDAAIPGHTVLGIY